MYFGEFLHEAFLSVLYSLAEATDGCLRNSKELILSGVGGKQGEKDWGPPAVTEAWKPQCEANVSAVPLHLSVSAEWELQLSSLLCSLKVLNSQQDFLFF